MMKSSLKMNQAVNVLLSKTGGIFISASIVGYRLQIDEVTFGNLHNHSVVKAITSLKFIKICWVNENLRYTYCCDQGEHLTRHLSIKRACDSGKRCVFSGGAGRMFAIFSNGSGKQPAPDAFEFANVRLGQIEVAGLRLPSQKRGKVKIDSQGRPPYIKS